MEGPSSSPLQSFSTYCYICDMPTNNSLTTMWSPHCLDRWRREVCLKELPPWFLFSSSSTPSTGHSGLLLWGFSVQHVIRCWMDWTPLGWSSSTVSLWKWKKEFTSPRFPILSQFSREVFRQSTFSLFWNANQFKVAVQLYLIYMMTTKVTKTV